MSKLNSYFNSSTSYEIDEDDSDIEYDESDSDDEIDVAIKRKLGLPTRELSEEEDDDFTAEMEGELTARVNKLQPATARVSSTLQTQPRTDVLKQSESVDGENLPDFYDPQMDEDDQQWVDNRRRSYLHPQTPGKKEGSSKPIPSSDAVLNCPACLSLLCLDCQRHDLYFTQYRAMFVINCRIDEASKMEYKIPKGKRRRQEAATELYNPVYCAVCNTEVAVCDKDEVYHFFNVLASHS